MKACITGAFSFTGKYIARKLLERGEEVITLTGHPDRPDPFNGAIAVHPLDFDNPNRLSQSLEGVHTLFNTYWIRFDRGNNTQTHAVENTRKLVQAAVQAGAQRLVHVSITNPRLDSHLSYFRGKAANEKMIIESGLSYAILRPTVLFGREDILINNIAFLLRRFPLFAIPGDGTYRLQPVYVDDLASLAVECGCANNNVIWDAVGPDIFPFKELVRLISRSLGLDRPILQVPPRLALTAARWISLIVRDTMLTPQELDGLMANLLVSSEPPRCPTHLADWLREHRDQIGRQYASELARHYQ